MIEMTTAIYEETKKDINEAYRQKRKSKIQKETSFILSQIITLMMSQFKDRLYGISADLFDLNETYIFSDENQRMLLKWLDRFILLNSPISDLEFGKLKIDLESWYLQIGGKNLRFFYREDYLLTPTEAAKALGVSRVTLNKYVKSGLEVADTNSHSKIPRHAIELWKDPIYGIKMQMLYQKKKLATQTPKERLREVQEKILDFQLKYKKPTSSEAFAGMDVDSLDDPYDYWEWRDLEKEREKLMKKLMGEADVQ
ncbi:helix-turn-helix domain-containing protein [Caldibacillus debilis]|uniref:Helix-turn-helix domain-containing protein n=1 Tax=Caldibacillus debilis GB1 TaxID=1339248 RepID=A0A420VDU6_9BACI|nr:helix-turn-helix domain-containing protein [Caldibacillus debilis]RKO61746.1 hypothetical protein Cdeb_01217 [Caldibacillus debilis GB1]